MFFSINTQLLKINYRINLMHARGEQMNWNLIQALLREKRNLEKMR